ncbi:hypothetical protein [Cloacibacterium sp.]|uniref:hypothetical protein n=1 Tax=Cloacibacterium sp. TaxID=1913682 RepID=UPI0039E38D23
MKQIFLLLFFPIILFAQNSEEYKVYSQFLQDKNFDSKKTIVLKKETKILSDEKLKELKYENLKKTFLKSLEKETFDDFIKINKTDSNLDSIFKNDKKVVIINENEIHEIFKDINTGWNFFYKKFPNSIGLLRLSRIGFNKSKTQAFFYYDKTSGMLTGSGNYILFEKQNGKWTLKSSYMNWIS